MIFREWIKWERIMLNPANWTQEMRDDCIVGDVITPLVLRNFDKVELLTPPVAARRKPRKRNRNI